MRILPDGHPHRQVADRLSATARSWLAVQYCHAGHLPQSGSNGNCIYVEAGGVRLLFDAGISGSQVKERLALHGRKPVGIDAVLISHDHVDHCRSMGNLHRKFGLPIYATAKTYRAASRYRLGEIEDLHHFSSGDTLRFGKVVVETIPTPHDGVDGVVFVVDDGRHRLGILTDLGHVFGDLEAVIGSLDAVLLESNYDPEMLANGPYPGLAQRDASQAPAGIFPTSRPPSLCCRLPASE